MTINKADVYSKKQNTLQHLEKNDTAFNFFKIIVSVASSSLIVPFFSIPHVLSLFQSFFNCMP